MNWTDDRIKEFEDMHRLLIEVRDLNSGSHVIERMQRCMELANRLLMTDFSNPRPSFFYFVQDLIIEERKAAKSKDPA